MELTELLSRSFRSLLWIFETKSLKYGASIAENTMPRACRATGSDASLWSEPTEAEGWSTEIISEAGFLRSRTFWCEVQVTHRVIVIQKNAGFDSPWAIAAHRRWFSESSHRVSAGRKEAVWIQWLSTGQLAPCSPFVYFPFHRLNDLTHCACTSHFECVTAMCDNINKQPRCQNAT